MAASPAGDGHGAEGGCGLYPSRVIGHRGACALAPENTLAAIRRAAGDGARMVEVDVVLTADGRPILFHDHRLERTTDGFGPVAAASLATVGALDAGGWFSPDYAGEPVPTLEEAVEVMVELGLGLTLELKPTPGRDAETARLALAALRAGWPADRPPPVISSFSREALAVARDHAPDWPRALISMDVPGDWTEAALILDLKALHLADSGVAAAAIDRVAAAGHAVAVFTVNDPARARSLWTLGAAAVFADDPGAVLRAAR
jgi:glycerophosphoryl diester phosphodiesterase